MSETRFTAAVLPAPWRFLALATYITILDVRPAISNR